MALTNTGGGTQCGGVARATQKPAKKRKKTSFTKVSTCEPSVLTEVSALDGVVVEGDTEVVTCLSQLRNGNAVRAADYPRLVVILPF